MRGQRHAPAEPTPGKDSVHIVQEAGWASGPVWTGAENLAPPGLDPRTVQPVCSRYTDYATPAHKLRSLIDVNCNRHHNQVLVFIKATCLDPRE